MIGVELSMISRNHYLGGSQIEARSSQTQEPNTRTRGNGRLRRPDRSVHYDFYRSSLYRQWRLHASHFTSR